jgi:hypothetical protein
MTTTVTWFRFKAPYLEKITHTWRGSEEIKRQHELFCLFEAVDI